MRAITSITSTLGSRGWALLVLVGGFALAIPFFKGDSLPRPQYTSVKESASSNTRSQSTQSLPIGDSLPIPSPNILIDKSNLQKEDPTWQTRINVANASEPTGQTEAPASPNKPSLAAIDSSQIIQPSMQKKEPEIAGGTSTLKELPAWAKKPSVLDTLVTSKTNIDQALGIVEQQLPEARKPSPYRAWTAEDHLRSVATNSNTPIDRYSPFRDFDETPIAEQNSTRTPTSWPDEDPRTAVSTPKADERLVGRDAIIRDPNILQSLPEQIGRTAVHPNTPPSLLQENIVVQPKFGEPRVYGGGSSKPQIGAALRSRLPPNELQFIQQPRIQ